MVYAAVDAASPEHPAARDLLVGWEGELVVSAFVAAEADHLILTRLGIDAELRYLSDLAGVFLVEGLDHAGLLAAGRVCRRYRDLELGLADASVVVLAEKWRTTSLGTFDERHFRAVRPLQGGSFRLLPGDGD